MVKASRRSAGRSSVRPRYPPQVLFTKTFYDLFVYIIYSEKIDQYYIGHSADLDDRFFRHLNSASKATKKANDWEIAYKEKFDTKSLAYNEMEIKRKKSRKYIEWLINSVG